MCETVRKGYQMRKLKCTDCGGQVRVVTTAEGHVLGRCQHCQAEFVLDARGRQHVIVEHRFPDSAPLHPRKSPAPQSLSRRGVLLAGAAVLAGGAAWGLLGRSVPRPAAPPGAQMLFNVGGEGAAPGQFREHIFDMGIDSLGQAVLIDNDERVYLFGPEGNFLANYALGAETEGRFCAVLPSGELILATHQAFLRIEAKTGRLITRVEAPGTGIGRGHRYTTTPEGGIAAWISTDTLLQSGGSAGDQIIFFGPDLRETRRLSGLLQKAIAPDPMIRSLPEVTDLAINSAGSLFLNARPVEDHDPRGGIYEFNAEGVFQRRIGVKQAWHGRIAIGPGDEIWYGDAWMDELQIIATTGEIRRLRPPPATGRETAVGNISDFAFYPNGDVGMSSMNHRFVRLRPPAAVS